MNKTTLAIFGALILLAIALAVASCQRINQQTKLANPNRPHSAQNEERFNDDLALLAGN